jgi:hypothetical protein
MIEWFTGNAGVPAGGRTWWARFEFTPINIELTILEKKMEDVREVHPATSTRLVHTAAFSRE